VILTAPSLPRAVRPEILFTMTDHPNVRVAPALSDALRMLEEVPGEDMVLITGSLFLVGEARALLAPAEG
jgi:folylpolyglutamate synthase/dihydropteroate synthase